MTREVIYTAFHKADWTGVHAAFRTKVDMAAKYYVDNEVVEVITHGSAWKSVKALVDADMLKLPFSPMLIEFSATEKFRWFILLEDKGDHFKSEAVYLHFPTGKTVWTARDITVKLDEQQFNVSGVTHDNDAHAIVCAVTMATLFLNTKGIEKKVVTPEALNKARARKGKVPVPTVTTIRIGTIYDRSGMAHRQTEGATGRRMPVHLRAGHARQQHHGPNNELIKWVYIEPVIVNYNPGDGTLPELTAKVARKVKL